MEDNVLITLREHGRVVDKRSGHNVWTEYGREYLAKRITLDSHDPDVHGSAEYIQNIQFGIGSNRQANLLSANTPPLSTSYPAGFDPHATVGNTYRSENQLDPLISTLERPVRVTGSENPYSTALGTDVWFLDPSAGSFITSHPTPSSVRIRAFLDATAGNIVYGSFNSVPLSEIGLFTTVDINSPYPGNCVAYHSFGTLELTDAIELEVEWTIGF